MKNRADLAVLVLIVAVAACMVLAGLTKSKRWAEIVECRNSLRVIGQSIIDYAVPPDHHFPQAAMPNPALPVEKRLSWHVSIVSYVVSDSLYSRMDKEASWDAEQNRFAATLPHRWFQCRAVYPLLDPSTGWGPTTYVGIAGIGPDAASLPKDSPRAGFFGSDRQLSPADVERRSDSLMMVVETVRTSGSWIAGGEPTVRGLQPGAGVYLGIGGQFGGLHRGGANALFADGSVRFLSNDISPTVFEGFATLQGSGP